MLDLLNRYAHGFVVVPVVLAARRGGLFTALESQPSSAAELSESLHANSGHLQAVLRLLQSLGWIDRRNDDRFVARPEIAKAQLIPGELQILVEADMDAYLRHGPGGFLMPWVERGRMRWGVDDALLPDFFDSLLVVPVLALLTKRKILQDLPGNDFGGLPSGVRDEVIEFLQVLGWLNGEPGNYELTPPGEFMFERAMNLGVVESYRPMLSAMDALLFGDAEAVFALDADGNETHVDRSMNVISSGFMHDRYFAEVEEILISIFSREPFSAQPRYVADMGSGDGTFLKRVFETVRDKTPRGKRLAEYPLTMIGIDLNRASINETSRTLAEIDHLVVTGDIGNPVKVVADLEALGVDPERILHIRSFLDHDRPYVPPADAEALTARAGARYLGAYVDRKGRAIVPEAAVQSLVEHLQRWADVITEHGFILLEVHCQDPLVVRAHIDQSESLYFDAIEAFSHQLLVEADAALMAAAEAGLFPRRDYFRKFPGFLPYCRITLNLFERRPYRVRLARVSDIPALLHLEEACWPSRMRVAAEELQRRIETYALGQWVLEMNGDVCGVVYSQRIADIDDLRHCSFGDLPGLRDDNGEVVQLLGLNVLPEMQHLGLGDQLLDLMLMRSALQGGVRRVAGITRCKEFSGRSIEELDAYVAQRDASDRPVDPVLQFHHDHGAEFLGVVADYRAEDEVNLGAGVLLCYDFSAPGTTLQSKTAIAQGANEGDTKSRLEACLRSLLGPSRENAFSWHRALRDMGLDSLNLLEFRTMLQQTFGQPLSPTFFFSHPTPADIERSLSETLAAPETEAQAAAVERVRLDADAGAEEARAPAQAFQVSAQGASAVPVAVVGMAGRFAGCEDLEHYWDLLASGRDAVTEVPSTRWDVDAYYSADPDAPGKIVSRYGGFLNSPEQFDASFFNISPPEAKLMDPQQRLLLESHWEALENAGINPERLRDSACGIFVGLYSHDYELLQTAAASQDLGPYYATGSSASIAAGRLAYFLGTHGPALTLDTACSSSLVAVHQAIRSLRSGECDLAMASGASLILSPRLSIAFSKAGMLAPDGRCKTFDASANGYVRSEGCGVVVLKRLDEALRDGDTVFAVLRGSAVNQDGASNGLTAPSLPAQEQLLRLALRDAALQPCEIDYVEAHGTGTSLGDPVEFQALQQVFHEGRNASEPLWIGSVKTNIGHSEAVAGVAGLIKVVLSLYRQWMPAHLHFRKPNPQIDLDAIPARIPVQGSEWRRDDRPLRSGISSFGFSGTNAHVIVEQAPPLAPPEQGSPESSHHLLTLSAKSVPALQALTGRYLSWLQVHEHVSIRDVCYTSQIGRAHHNHRLAFVAADRAELINSLNAGPEKAGAARRVDGSPRLAFIFTGQGSQYAHMARELSLAEPTFRKALSECREILADELALPLEDILYPESGREQLLDETANTQPALFSVEYALARMLQSWGIEPSAVLGHSVGEYVAACIAGVFSLKDGLKLIAARGRLMQSLPRGGAMSAILGSVDAVHEVLKRVDGVSIAAYNGPESIVISGPRAAVEEAALSLEQTGARAVPLVVSHAFHSALMDPVLPAFEEVARSIEFSAPKLDFASNLTGGLEQQTVATPEYWVRHIREPVRFADGIRALAGRGIDIMLEIGPQPVLSRMGPPCLEGTDVSDSVDWLHTLTRDASDWQRVLETVGTLYERGSNVKWQEVNKGYQHRRVALPTYPWQRKSYWFRELPAAGQERSGMSQSRPADADTPAAEPLYSFRWIPQSRLDEYSPATGTSWIVLADASGVGAEFQRLAAEHGEECSLVQAGPEYEPMNQFRKLTGTAKSARIVNLRALDLPDQMSSAEALFESAASCGMDFVNVIRTAASLEAESLCLVTRSARTVRSGDKPALVPATLTGLGNVARVEYPELGVRMVDLEAGASAAASAALLHRELRVPSEDSRVAYRSSQRFVPALLSTPTEEHDFSCAGDGVYLIIGGIGDLGLHTARWLVEHGARRLVLIQRTVFPQRSEWTALENDPLVGEKIRIIREFEAQGVKIRIKSADVRARSQIDALLAALETDGWGDIRGVVQASAVVSAQLIDKVTEDEYRNVLSPKVAGTWNLYEAFRSRSLDFLLLYSSIGAVIGLPGQASYAAANAFLDAMGSFGHAQGVPVISINWCGWLNTGVARTDSGRRSIDELQLLGINSLSPAQATALLGQAIASQSAQIVTIPLDQSRQNSATLVGLDPLIARIASAEERRSSMGRVPNSNQPPVGFDRDHIEQLVTKTIAELLDIDESMVDPNRSLGDMGMDSLLGLEFRKAMQSQCGIVLSATLVWNYPTVRAISSHLASRMSDALNDGGGRRTEESSDEGSHSRTFLDVEDLSDEEALRQLTGRM